MPKLSLPLSERREVAGGTMSFRFDLDGQPYSFRPGQYNSVTLSNPLYQDEEGNTRPFSVASSPRDPFILVATRMRGSAFKRTLAEVPLDTRVNFSGPMGSFTLPEATAKPVVLIAGGIGITPFRSMIKHVTEEKLPHRLTLIYSNRTPQDAPFMDDLYGWERENASFRFIPTMTKPGAAQGQWTGRTGYVDATFLRETLSGLGDSVFYAAGPPEMVDALERALREAGVAEDNIRVEQFSGY